jgi:hypothetical protein
MKKYLKRCIIGAVIGFCCTVFIPTAHALSPGSGGNLNCKIWHESDGVLSDWSQYCKTDASAQEEHARLYALEVAVNDLQSQNKALQNLIATKPVNVCSPTVQTVTVAVDNARITGLETRMKKTELDIRSLVRSYKILNDLMASFRRLLNK